jgi:hypothetical protein
MQEAVSQKRKLNVFYLILDDWIITEEYTCTEIVYQLT